MCNLIPYITNSKYRTNLSSSYYIAKLFVTQTIERFYVCFPRYCCACYSIKQIIKSSTRHNVRRRGTLSQPLARADSRRKLVSFQRLHSHKTINVSERDRARNGSFAFNGGLNTPGIQPFKCVLTFPLKRGICHI